MKVLQFIAMALTALALVPAGAHFFELPNKIHLAQNDYFIVQTIYRGWALFGIVLFGALVSTLALAIVTRELAAPFVLVVISVLCQLATLVIFFLFTFPANQATHNWTAVPENWEALRRQWEYAHAASAVIAFAAFCALTLSLLTAKR